MASTKKCKKCGYTLPTENFHKNKGKADGLDDRCKDCKRKERSARRRANKVALIEYKGGRCQVCGVVGPPCIYDFHHPDSDDKEFTISEKDYSFEKLKKEADKTMLVCSNCHRRIHAGE